MIIFGSKSREIANEPIGQRCGHCGTENSLTAHVFQKYAHIFWIPTFPMGKTSFSQCGHCKQVLELGKTPSSLTDTHQDLRSRAKTPIWTFAGIMLLAGLITVGIVVTKWNDSNNAQLITEPQTGDVYEVKTKDKQYTLYKVAEVKGDSVLIKVHNYEASKLNGLRALKDKGDGEYSDEVIPLTKSELKQMYDNGEILDIDR